VHYRLNGGTWQSLSLSDDGQHGDGAAGDSLYADTLSTAQWGSVALEVYWEAVDALGQTSRFPRCRGERLSVPYTPPRLRLNELMADNSGVWLDEHGEADDWLEIYNADSVAVYLGDKYLSDDPARPDRWRLPAVTLAPDRYLVVWADGEGFQGNRHANFRLSAGGETLGLYGPLADGLSPIDTVAYGPQPADAAYGRLPNGTGPWQPLPFLTPGGHNAWAVGTPAWVAPTALWQIAPNPVAGPEIVLVPTGATNGTWQAQLFDAQGRSLQLWSFTAAENATVRLPWANGALPKGQYWLRLQDEAGSSTVVAVQR
jgi:hypothetical protein